MLERKEKVQRNRWFYEDRARSDDKYHSRGKIRGQGLRYGYGIRPDDRLSKSTKYLPNTASPAFTREVLVYYVVGDNLSVNVGWLQLGKQKSRLLGGVGKGAKLQK